MPVVYVISKSWSTVNRMLSLFVAVLMLAFALVTVVPVANAQSIEISSGILDSEKKNGPRWKRINFDPLVEGTHIIRVAWDGDANVKFNVLRADGTRLNSKNVRGSNPGIWSGKLDANEQYYIGLWSANGIANYTASIELEMVDVEPAPPVTALNLGEGVLDSQKVVGPRFIRLDFDAIASAIHTITVSWDSDADVKYNVLRADGTRLNSRNIRGSNPGVWSGELDANEQYYIGLWSASGITNYAAEVRVPPGSDTGVPVVDMSNLPPIANAGTDITIVQGAELTLDGTGSSDADGVISSYVWSIGTEVISTQSVYTTSNIVVGNYSVKLEVTDDSNSKDVDFMTLKVVEDVEVNLPPVAEDLNVTSLEDTAVVLDLVATDANSNSPLLYSIETSPINGEITLINSEFVYTPNPNFFGVDTLTFKANDGEFDSNIAKVTITVESINDAPTANAGGNIFIFEGDTVVINGAESTDDGGIVSYLWSLNDQFIGSTPTVAIDEFLLGDNVVQLRVIDDAGLDDIDTVIVTVTARQEPDTGSPGIFTSDVRGSTTTVNASAEFDVVLSSEPTDLVTIPIYSSDVTEGEVAVSELVFSSTNWDSPQTVTIFGRNDSVTDGIQDYSIVLSPAVSNDPSYSGLDPDDVAIQGVQLALLELEQNMLIQGIPVGISIPIRYIGNNPLRFSFSPEYPGIRYSSTSGSFFYDGSDSTPAQFNIEVVVTDGVVSTRRTLDINVVASPEVNLIIDGEYHVAENQVVRFGLQKGLAGIDILPSEVNLKASFSGFDHLPPPPADVQPLSPIFRLSAADGDYSISALWPVDLVDTRSIINRATLFRYSTEYGWDPGSSFPESRIINGREWFELGHAVRDTPIFIGIGPDRADPNRPLPNLSGNRINERAQTRARVVPPAIPLEAIECDLAGFDKPETGSFQGNFTCRYESFKVSITNFLYDSFGNSTMWSGSTSVKEFASWVFEAMDGITQLKMASKTSNDARIQFADIATLRKSYHSRGKVVLHNDSNVSSQHVKNILAHELFHAAQYGLPNKNKNVFHQVSGSDSRWLVEGTARWFEDFMYDNDDAYKLHNTLDPDLGFAASIFAPSTKKGRSVPPIFQPGLAKTEIPGLEFVSRGAKTSNFWKLLNSKCEGFVNNFNVLFSSFGEMAGGTVVEQAGMTGVLKILENSGCDFGEHMGEDKVSSLESAMAFYQYATQSEHKISLLDENEVDNSPTETKPTSYRFEQPRMFSAENWRGRIFDEDEFLPNRLFLELGIDSFPAYSAVSINVSDALDRVLEYQKEIQRSDFRFIRSMEGVLKIRTKDEKPLQVSLLVDNDNFKTGKEGFLLNGQPHFGYDSTEMCNDEFVFPITPRLSTSQLGDLFITITNPTGEIIDLSKAELQIRDTRPFRDNKRNVVIDRRDQRMFTDTIESVNSTFTHAEAVEYCAQEHAGYNDWQLPGAQTLAGYAWNHANEPFFENHLPEKEYWARGTDGDLGGVVRITPLTIRLTDLSFKKHVRCVRVDTSVCGIDQ